MVDIIIKIPNDKIDEFKLGFIKAYPKIAGETDLKLIKRFIREKLIQYYITGKTILVREENQPYIEIDLVEE